MTERLTREIEPELNGSVGAESAKSVESEFSNQLHALVEYVNDMVDEFNRFAAKWQNSDWKRALGPVLSNYELDLKNLAENIRKMVEDIIHILDHSTPIISLISQGYSWLDNVMRPTANIQSVVKEHPDANFEYWDSKASGAYDDAVTAQDTALAAIVEKSDGIRKWLLSIAAANIEFVTELCNIFAEFAGKFVAILAEAATVIGILEAIGKSGECIENIIAHSGKRVTKAIEMYGAAAGRTGEATSLTFKTAAFPHGKWPGIKG